MSVEPRLETLANGLRIATARLPGSESASIAITIEAGTRDETEAEHGLAHLLEHMAFKGTGRRSARAIVEEIEAVGGDINAETGAEHTTFSARVLGEHLESALDVLADLLTDPRFIEADLRLEKSVVAQEIGAALDVPDDRVNDLLAMAAYGEHALGRPILGTLESLTGLSIADLEGFRQRLYAPGRMVISAAGAVDHDVFIKAVERRLGHLVARDVPARQPARRLSGRRSEKGGGEVNMAFAFDGAAFGEDGIYALHMAGLILGGGMSSRLFQSAREEKGLCYGIDAMHWAFVDGGLFVVQSASAPDNADELVATISSEVLRLSDGVSAEELARARAQTRAATVFADESTSAFAARMARQTLLFGAPLERAVVLADIEAVDRQAIAEAAHRIVAAPPAIAVVGPRASRTALSAVAAMRGLATA